MRFFPVSQDHGDGGGTAEVLFLLNKRDIKPDALLGC